MNMDWNAIAAVGEILGAVAVVVTLLYLSKQIRQNSRAVQVAALRDTTAEWKHWSELLASSPDLAEIVARGNGSYRIFCGLYRFRLSSEHDLVPVYCVIQFRTAFIGSGR